MDYFLSKALRYIYQGCWLVGVLFLSQGPISYVSADQNISSHRLMISDKQVSDEKMLVEINHYLSQLDTLSGVFSQINHKGDEQTGFFGMRMEEKNAQMVFLYEKPKPYKLVKKYNQLYLLKGNKPKKQITLDKGFIQFLSQGKTPLAQSQIKEMVLSDNQIMLTLNPPFETQQAVIKLIFHNAPIKLWGWEVKDAQGRITHIFFKHVVENAPLPHPIRQALKHI